MPDDHQRDKNRAARPARDEVVRLRPGERVLMDILDVARKPDSHGIFHLDMSGTRRYRREFRARCGVPLTDVHIVVKAVARYVAANPALNAMVQGDRIARPSSVDVGVSVLTPGVLAQVVVIKNAQDRSLADISKELRERSEQAAQEQEAALRRLDRAARMLPVRALRRAAVRFAASRYRVRRAAVGTVQVTSIGLRDLEMHLPSHMGTTLIFSLGGVARRPIAVGNRVAVRHTAYLAVGGDTRVVQAVGSIRAGRQLRHWIEKPETLEPLPDIDGDSAGSPGEH